MKIIQASPIEREGYVILAGVISQRLEDKHYVATLSAELEDGESTQYPLEDLLEEYDAYADKAEETVAADGKRLLLMEIGSPYLEQVQAMVGLVGKRAFYHFYYDEDEREYAELRIE